MRVEIGDQVFTADGQELGRVRNLIVNDATNEIGAIVVEKGFILVDDIVVRLEDLSQGPDNRLHVKYRADETADLPRFHASDYQDAGPAVTTALGYPNAGLLWGAADPYPGAMNAQGPVPIGMPVADVAPAYVPDPGAPEGEEGPSQRHLLTEGKDVRTADGVKVGEVHQVVFDGMSGRTISLVISRGWLFTEEVEVPGTEIASVDEDAVTLSLTQDQFDKQETAPNVPFV